MARRAVFLDRDGVLIRDVHLLTERHQVELYPGASQALRILKAAGYYIFVVSNQPVVARGLVTEEDVRSIHEWIQHLLRTSDGGRVDEFYFCPHHPNATQVRYRIACDCRKPQPGLLLRAARQFEVELSASYMVGDRVSDIVAGHRAGCHTILVTTGEHTAPPIESVAAYDPFTKPDHACRDLPAAAALILGTLA
jgi:D-glycero-D-manno-heptose 1,7-bisphosphate phosphatase